jgi:hypothetical protein
LQVAQSWPRHNTWEQHAHLLLRAYHIDSTTALVTSRTQFATMTRVGRQFVLERTRENTGSTTRGTALISWTRPLDQTHPPHNCTIACLVSGGKWGYAAEFIMKLRLECLPLKAWTAGRFLTPHASRRNAPHPSMVCPCCHTAAETMTHFLLECPTHSQSSTDRPGRRPRGSLPHRIPSLLHPVPRGSGPHAVIAPRGLVDRRGPGGVAGTAGAANAAKHRRRRE